MADTINPRPPLSRRSSLGLFALGAAGLRPRIVRAAAKSYGPGVTDTSIKIGNFMAYSGPGSSLGSVGKAATAYFTRLNQQGGVNGRSIEFISLDDSYSPPKSVELTRRLVEQEQVLGLFCTLGTQGNAAVQRYLNDRKVPHLMIFSGAARFRDPRNAPWSMGGDLAFLNETQAFAHYILTAKPDARIGVLYQNDDFGKDHLAGLRNGLGDRRDLIAKVVSFEATDANVDSQIIQLQQAGSDVLLIAAIPKFAAQAIRKIFQINWKPLRVLGYPAASIPATFAPAGLDASTGIVSADFVKQPGDPAWANDPEMLAYLDLLKTHAPDLNPDDKLCVFGYYSAAATVELLRRCGDDLTRENLRYQATHLQQMPVPMLLPGITMTTTPDDYAAIKQLQLQRFDGKGWERIGGVAEG